MALSTSAFAQPSSLAYEVEVEGASCPSEEGFRQDVARRIGRDPFGPEGPAGLIVRVHVGRNASRLSGTVVVTGADGDSIGTRTLEAGLAQCHELVETLAVSLGLALDQPRTGRPPVTATSSSASTSASALAQIRQSGTYSVTETVDVHAPDGPAVSVRSGASPARASASTSRPLALRLSVLGAVAAGQQPELTGALHGGLGLRLGNLSLRAEARLASGAEIVDGGGEGAATSRVAVALAPCLHVTLLSACAIVEAAHLQAHGLGLESPRSGGAWTLAVGAGLGAEWTIAGPLAMIVRGEIGVPVLAGALYLGDEPLWQAPPIQGSVGAGLLLQTVRAP